ncbi:MAG TPA: hypothetical protein VGS22_15160 [Thermoanaerobaculia bacterium]|jgi:hypothetical protein|nr:hypothetical protein [Thermoanaerobaculia bacterium]
MNTVRSRRRRVVLATVLASLTALSGAAAETAPPSIDAVTEKVREIIRRDDAYALQALARRTGRDTPWQGNRRLAAAAAAWH